MLFKGVKSVSIFYIMFEQQAYPVVLTKFKPFDCYKRYKLIHTHNQSSKKPNFGLFNVAVTFLCLMYTSI